MGIEVGAAILIGSVLAGGATVYSQHQAEKKQAKRQDEMLANAEAKEQSIKNQAANAAAKSKKDARKRALSTQRSKTNTILTNPDGLEEKETTKKNVLGA